MASTPTSTYLSTTSTPIVRGHRHKRSGAISGDFDLSGLGLLSPNHIKQGASHIPHKSNPTYISPKENTHLNLRPSSFAYDSEQNTTTKHFNFSNEEDFTNKPFVEGFHFPSPNSPYTSSKGADSGRKGASVKSQVLNSPIRLKSKGSFTSTNGPSKLFLTDETTLDEHNVPDPLIDLDRVLSASSAKENEIFDGGKYSDCFEFCDSNFTMLPSRMSSVSTPLSVSPYSSPAYLKQPIKEPANDAIEEEDDNDDTDTKLGKKLGGSSAKSIPDDHIDHAEDSELNSLPHGSVNLYTASLNSSASSLQYSQKYDRRDPSGISIEKISSNASRESPFTFVGVNGTPTPKRFSAKANRYQAFYEQSSKISSSLKFSSSESVHFISPIHLDSIQLKGDLRPLEHSLSLPSLKSGKIKGNSIQSIECRITRDFSRSSGNFDACSNASDYAYAQKRENSTHSLKGSPDVKPSRSACEVISASEKDSFASSYTASQAFKPSVDSKLSPESRQPGFEGINLLGIEPQGHEPNLGASRSTTPTIVVSSGGGSEKSDPPNISEQLCSQCNIDLNHEANSSDRSKEMSDVTKPLEYDIKSLSIESASSNDSQKNGGSGAFSPTESKITARRRGAKIFGHGISAESNTGKSKRISSWLRRMKDIRDH